MPLPIAGVKWGLANIVTLVALGLFGFREVLTISVMRCFLASVLMGTFLAPAFMMSISGGVLSTCVMYFAYKKFKSLSLVGVSIIGAVSHNIGQLLAASFLVSQSMIIAYLPILLVSAIPTGIITGIVGVKVAKRVRF